MDHSERQKKFETWAEDLERRLALFLFELPEQPFKKDALIVSPVTEPDLLDVDKKTVVDVRDLGGRWWAVYLNGIEVVTFYGPEAQKRASKFANDLLNAPGHIE